jgi:predicted enzyme related to lactoylglutathione lyase
MSERHTITIGAISWADLTVPDAAALRAFYARVVGWESTGFDMGGYEDYCMNEPGSGHTVAGICHARGENASLPPQWLIYITVRDLARSTAACTESGGEVISGPRTSPQGKYSVIRDPAGAVCALFEPA